MERALLVAIEFDYRYGPVWPLEDERRELEELATSAGCEIVGHIDVRRHTPVAGTYIGSGKLEEIAGAATTHRAQVVIFNQELSPAQQRNVEELVGVKTIDRTQLILDIFAQRARSGEGKVQVELAQLQYLLPRLVGKGVLLSRLGGGIGTRGPGEQKLEVDRRHIRRHISHLTRELDKLESRRKATRQRRQEAHIPVVALVGYTNAGKSTLLNRLSGAEGRVENRLFTTLDPLARRVRLPAPPTSNQPGAAQAGPSGRWMVLTDTVGFLHRLPHHLIEAFKATLEEAEDARLLLHVLDASHPLAEEQAEAVQEVLQMLHLQDKPLLTVLNKIDQLTDQGRLASLERQLPHVVAVSALRGQGLDRLLEMIERQLSMGEPSPEETAGGHVEPLG